MHIATCRLFSLSGHYELERMDEDGWPHYKLLRPVPFANLKEQERIVLSLYYFEELKLHEIAKVLELTESRVSQIRSKALSKLRVELRPLREHVA